MNPIKKSKLAIGRTVLIVIVVVIVILVGGAAAAASIKPSSSSSTSTNSSTTTSATGSQITSSYISTTSSSFLSTSTTASSTNTVASSSTTFITSYLTGTVLTETSLPYTVMAQGNYNLSKGITVNFYQNNGATLTGCFTSTVPVNFFVNQNLGGGATSTLDTGLGVTQHCFNVALTSSYFYSIIISASSSPSAYLTVTSTVKTS